MNAEGLRRKFGATLDDYVKENYKLAGREYRAETADAEGGASKAPRRAKARKTTSGEIGSETGGEPPSKKGRLKKGQERMATRGRPKKGQGGTTGGGKGRPKRKGLQSRGQQKMKKGRGRPAKVDVY